MSTRDDYRIYVRAYLASVKKMRWKYGPRRHDYRARWIKAAWHFRKLARECS
jgi:hypothetical protein